MNKRLTLALALFFLLAGLGYFFVTRDSGAPAAEPNEPAAAQKEGPTRGQPRSVRRIAPTRAMGIVSSDAGQPVEGALVVLRPLDAEKDEESEPLHVRTDTKGAWQLQAVPSGRYAITASAPGFLPGVLADVDLLAEQDNAGLDLTLRAGGSLFRGVVSDVMGGPVEGAFVSVAPMSGMFGRDSGPANTARTNDAGEFQLQVAPGRHRVRVRHLDYTPTSIVLEFAEGTREQNFKLSPMSVIEGVVIEDEGGKPVSGALVAVAREREMMLPGGGGRGDTFLDPLRTIRADGQGRFRVRGLQSGTVALRAMAEGLGSEEPTFVPLGIAETKEGIELRVGEARTLRGRVHVSGAPEQFVEGAEVQVMGRDAFAPHAKTDADGRFAVHGLREGPVTLMASARGYLPAFPRTKVMVEAENPELMLELDPGLAVRGRVEPPEAALVRIDADPNTMDFSHLGGGNALMVGAGGSTRAKPDGSFEVAPVLEGKITLVAETDDGRAGSVEVTVGPEGAQDVVIELEERGRYAGRVLDASGKPVANATVSLSEKHDSNRRVTLIVNGRNVGASASPTDEDGQFEIRGLEAASYEVRVSAPGLGDLAWAQPEDPKRPSAPMMLELGEAEKRDDVVLTVEARSGYIRGRVLTAEGQPAPDVWVRPSLQTELEPEPSEGGEERNEMVMMIASGDDGGSSPVSSLPPVLTDAEGRFAVEQLRNGKYTLVAEAPGGGGRTKQSDIRPNADITLELAPLASVSGSIEASGMQVDGAFVSVDGPVRRQTRVKNGRYEVDRLDPGRYSIELSTAEGSAGARFTVEAGESATVDLTMQKLLRVRGRVLDADGKPMEGARIMLAGGPPAEPGAEGEPQELEISIEAGEEDEVTTDAEGRFDVPAASGMRVILVTGPSMPMPIAIKPVMVGSEDVDVGDIRQGDMPQGAMMGGPPPGEAPDGAPPG